MDQLVLNKSDLEKGSIYITNSDYANQFCLNDNTIYAITDGAITNDVVNTSDLESRIAEIYKYIDDQLSIYKTQKGKYKVIMGEDF